MLYPLYILDDLLNPSKLCIYHKDILHDMTALSESKSVKKCRSYYLACLFHRHFLRELTGFSRLAHIVSTIDC